MEEPLITPLPGKTNVSIVFEQLEEIILGGFWKPDEKMPTEAELGRKFNVGRSTIREALNMLKAKNLVYTVPGQGSFVCEPVPQIPAIVLSRNPDPKNGDDILNLMELRLSIEPMTAAFAARRATGAQIEGIRAANEILFANRDAEPEVVVEKDMAFHLALAEASGNHLFLDVMAGARSLMREQQLLTAQHVTYRYRSCKFHDHVLEAVAAHDDTAAEDIMRGHMDFTYQHVRTILNMANRRSGRWRPRKNAAPAGPRGGAPRRVAKKP